MNVETVQTVVETTDRLVKTVVEEGLWIGLMADLFLVSGNLIPFKDEFLIAQRKAMVVTLRVITSKNIDFFGLDAPNPIGMIFFWLEPFVDLLEKQEVVDACVRGGQRVPCGTLGGTPAGTMQIWVALPPFERALFVIMIPGLFRAVLKTISGKML